MPDYDHMVPLGPLKAIFGHFGVILAVRARVWSLELLHFFGHYRSQPVFKKLLIDYLIFGGKTPACEQNEASSPHAPRTGPSRSTSARMWWTWASGASRTRSLSSSPAPASCGTLACPGLFRLDPGVCPGSPSSSAATATSPCCDASLLLLLFSPLLSSSLQFYLISAF